MNLSPKVEIVLFVSSTNNSPVDSGKIPPFSIYEMVGDHFSCSSGTALVHIVVQDCLMKPGIDKKFKSNFLALKVLCKQNIKVGEAAPVMDRDRLILN